AMWNPPIFIIGRSRRRPDLAEPRPYNRGMASKKRRWQAPEGLRVHHDGTWRVGDAHVLHPPSLRYFKSKKRRWQAPEGLRVHHDGTWRVGDAHVLHPPSLRYFKSHLVFEEEGAFIVDGDQRMKVDVEGPAYQVTSLVLDADKGEARVVLDDGTVETVTDDALGMNRETGRFESRVREGRATA